MKAPPSSPDDDFYDDGDLPLFHKPTARNTDPETSHEAAGDAAFRASHGRMLVLRHLYALGPLTDYELAAETEWQHNSIGKRRFECCESGLVTVLKIDDQVVKRPGPSGSNCRVWTLTEKGTAYMQSL